MTKRAYRFRFRKDLPGGAIRNQNYPEHHLAFLFLNYLVKGSANYRYGYRSPSGFSVALSTFPMFIELAKDLGYDMSSPRDKPHILSLRNSAGKHLVSCGSLDYGTLERFDPESLEDLANIPPAIEEK